MAKKTLTDKFNEQSNPMIVMRFPVFKPTDEEFIKLIKMVKYVESKFVENEKTPIDVDIVDSHDICPRSLATFSTEELE
jgi:hypothetical protein